MFVWWTFLFRNSLTKCNYKISTDDQMVDFIEENEFFFTFCAIKNVKYSTMTALRIIPNFFFRIKVPCKSNALSRKGTYCCSSFLSSNVIIAHPSWGQTNKSYHTWIALLSHQNHHLFLSVKLHELCSLKWALKCSLLHVLFSLEICLSFAFSTKLSCADGRAMAKHSFIQNCKHCNEISILGGICCALVKWTVMKLVDLVGYGTRHFSSIHWKKLSCTC